MSIFKKMEANVNDEGFFSWVASTHFVRLSNRNPTKEELIERLTKSISPKYKNVARAVFSSNYFRVLLAFNREKVFLGTELPTFISKLTYALMHYIKTLCTEKSK